MKESVLKKRLTERGFKDISRFDLNFSSLGVFKAHNSLVNKNRVLKIPSLETQDLSMFYKEFNGLKRINGMKGITSLVGLIDLGDFQPEEGLQDYEKFCPFVMEKEYAKGNMYAGQYLSAKEQQDAMDMIKNIHDEKYVNLDVKKTNFIYFPGKGLTFVDIFADFTEDISEGNIGSREIEMYKKSDLIALEGFL